MGDRRSRWRSLAGVPGVIVAVLPKATCPICVAAYAGAVSSLGLGFLLTDRVLNPIIIASLIISVGSVAWNTRRSGRLAPLLVSLIGACAVVLGRVVWSFPVAVYGGVVLLVGASVWTLWLNRPAPEPIVQVTR